MTLVLAASLFFTNPAPLEMPRAVAYAVREGSRQWLEDRYSTHELWTFRAVEGRWIDDDGRQFVLASLDTIPPPLAAEGFETRADYLSAAAPIRRRDERSRLEAIARLSPVELPEKPSPPRQMSPGYADIDYWQGTNESAVVCAFRPEKSDVWMLATWELAEGDDFADMLGRFEDEFLERDMREFLGAHPPRSLPVPSRKLTMYDERELLRADARHSVSNYPGWHATDFEGCEVLDHLPANRAFVAAFTNELRTMRRRYAETVPTPIDGTNVLCVARIFADREEFLEAVDDEVGRRSSAYWSPSRREIVAYLPADGEAQLLKTLRHEAFHQYLSYACSMIPVSPWLNEGYAVYFEDAEKSAWEDANADFDALAELLPALFGMDYDEFYDGSDEFRLLKYRLAWSVVRFIEKGADKVRFEPFRNLKRDYVRELLRSRDMKSATAAAFGSRENLDLFISEWKRYWKNT